jgi:glutamate synthase (NADPH/NADH) small chain
MYAMDFLRPQNKVVAGDKLKDQVLAKGKHVVVIGGGDTGSDCVGTSNRHGAKSVTQIELMPKPPEHENKALTWPYWPAKLRTSSSHEEGANRDWAITTKSLVGKNGKVEKLVAAKVEWVKDEASGQMKMQEVKGSEFDIQADLVLLAMGFVAPVDPVVKAFGVDQDARGNVRANTEDYQSSVGKVFAAGDMRRGQSLVVWAIREGRQCARSVDEFLMGSSDLPR